MKNKSKFKIILTTILLGLSLSSAQAEDLNFVEQHPFLSILGGVAGATYLDSVMHHARYLSYNLNQVQPYFQTKPQDFDPIAKYVLNALAQPANQSDYERYKKLAEVMGLNNIPPYVPTANNQASILANPQQEQNSHDNLLQNPIQENPISHIIYTPEGQPIDTSIEFPHENIHSWDEYLLLKQDSQELADNMRC